MLKLRDAGCTVAVLVVAVAVAVAVVVVAAAESEIEIDWSGNEPASHKVKQWPRIADQRACRVIVHNALLPPPLLLLAPLLVAVLAARSRESWAAVKAR